MNRTVEAGTLGEAILILREIKRRIEDPPVDKPLLKCAELLEARTIKNFLHSEDPQGIGWKPPKYRKLPPPTLVVTGTLQRAAIHAIRNAKLLGGELLIDASSPFYGKFHLTGTRNMVARPWLGFTEEHVEEMTEVSVISTVNFIVTGE